MKDFPVFTTENGVASLVLKEIPYRRCAYIILRDSLEPEALLAECISFCRACGAERVFAAGHAFLQKYPLHTVVYGMRGEAVVDKEKLVCLFPVTEQTVDRWREIYNRRMDCVDNSATLTYLDENRILASGGAYFVHDHGELLGIGWLEDTKILAMAAVRPGAGERVMHTLLSLVEGTVVSLEVASTNIRAIRLYEKLGFLKVEEISCWYLVG